MSGDRIGRLYTEHGQSPWLDNLRRGYLTSGELAGLRDRGVRGLTSNPTIFQKAIQGSADYDEQFGRLAADANPVIDDYWALVLHDILGALDVFAPVYDSSEGGDGFVSVEVDPGLGHDDAGTEAAARDLHLRIARANLMVKIPATEAGLPAIRQMIAEGRNVNVTLIFSLERHRQVMEAYLDGLEAFAATPGADLSRVASVASFFISRVDTEVDRRLDAVGTEQALALRGQAAVAQGQLAGAMARETFAGPRWERLVARGARFQRPLWASTSTKNPAYPDTLYVDQLIGPDTVNTIPEATLEAFEDHGTLARTLDADVEGARATWAAVGGLVDLDDVGRVLEAEGVTAFEKSYDELLGALETRARDLT